ncbi:MAG: hypothetical protein WKG32_23315 [Gemmatimonadaceae bacterium]
MSDRHHLTSPTHRRGFLGRLLSGAAVLAGGGAAAPLIAQGVTPGSGGAPGPVPSGAPRGPWDVTWADRLTAKHKQVFDAPEIAEGTALHQARTFMRGYADVYGENDSDMNAVLVFRHAGLPVVLGDPVWERYELGKALKLKDPTTGKPARRNPFTNVKASDKHSIVWPDGGLDTLIGRGATVLACNLALMGFAGRLATKWKVKSADVQKELRESLVPGVIVMPSGIFAVARAQEAGCNYIRAT